MIIRWVALVAIALMLLAALATAGDPEPLAIDGSGAERHTNPPAPSPIAADVEFAPMVAPCMILPPSAPAEACKPRGAVDCRITDPRRLT